MSSLAVRASSDEVGLRREATIDEAGLPVWLARLHRAIPVSEQVRISIEGKLPLPIETFMEGAGFRSSGNLFVAENSLPDMVAPSLKAIVSGLNPSPASVESRVPFHRAGNRFWPAALKAGLVTNDRDPESAMSLDRVGFTDLAKRCTPRASEISNSEYRAGLMRLSRVIGWTQPRVLIVVGLSGWRLATGQKFRAGWIDYQIGETPVYLMSSSSGLNTHETVASLATHFRRAMAGPTSHQVDP